MYDVLCTCARVRVRIFSNMVEPASGAACAFAVCLPMRMQVNAWAWACMASDASRHGGGQEHSAPDATTL